MIHKNANFSWKTKKSLSEKQSKIIICNRSADNIIETVKIIIAFNSFNSFIIPVCDYKFRPFFRRLFKNSDILISARKNFFIKRINVYKRSSAVHFGNTQSHTFSLFFYGRKIKSLFQNPCLDCILKARFSEYQHLNRDKASLYLASILLANLRHIRNRVIKRKRMLNIIKFRKKIQCLVLQQIQKSLSF